MEDVILHHFQETIMKKGIVWVCIALAAFVVVWCGQSTPQSNWDVAKPVVEEKKTVKIGVIAPLSGPASTYGQDMVAAIGDWYEAFSNDDVNVELIYEDGKCEGKASVDAVQKLINVDNVDFILWGACSGETVAAGKIAQQQWVLMLSPTASSPEISDIGDYVYRYWNDAQASVWAAEYMNENFENIALLVETTEYAQALADKVKEFYIGTISTNVNILSAEKDYSIVAKKISENLVDWIVLITQTESTTILAMKSFEDAWLLDKYKWKIISAYWFTWKQVQSEIPELVEGNIEVQMNNPSTNIVRTIDYVNSFDKKHGIQSLDLFAILPRESIQLYLDGITAGNYDSDSMKAYFDTITEDNQRDGFFGSYYFDENGDAVWLEYVVQTVVDGKWVPVE